MPRLIALLTAMGLAGGFTIANAQPATTQFDGTYRAVYTTNVNATYTDRNGRMAACAQRRPPGPLHIEHGQARYTTATGYKIRGTVDPQGQLQMALMAPSNSSNAGSRPLSLSVSGQIDAAGTARVRQTSNSCSYDFVWQRVQ